MCIRDRYKDEEKLLQNVEDADKVYVETILPEKMKYNLMYLENFGFLSDIKLMSVSYTHLL